MGLFIVMVSIRNDTFYLCYQGREIRGLKKGEERRRGKVVGLGGEDE